MEEGRKAYVICCYRMWKWNFRKAGKDSGSEEDMSSKGYIRTVER